ncbi:MULTISPECIES: aldo/keto reductase [unclassified Chelatococcus]|uniref:aldo/keto reductase n=1 Tax=unclassified Chelatococcus TaxID=2638111 RepID=UPI001BCB5786|nr:MULTISPECIES: aldo/keto reductase [unclassified Chelatococcus]CAH1651381.1 D-threo-aldose 1-dehydrogenase [Hyphomicrobiales bacterium]MBS7743179.1 aldo/keto reductase [Chelatococcus sp. HY11]MBX3541703.1 aldo/keto reductase [Chelatococcus sp.]MCO5074405.1 aldo/keto reductase [Chelatococcus sp.]CAH1693198.1 D-threo-aldose 1-dehydrogenase [Hyphomicrobiales bacterium]
MLPKLGLGCAAFGVLTDATSDSAVMALIDHAWNAGIRYFDTSPLYGSGRSEVLLGRALADHRPGAVLSTKVGHRLTAPFGTRPSPAERRTDFSASFVVSSVDESLTRLQRETIDLVLLHDPDEGLLDEAMDEALPALRELQHRGVIAAVGIGTNRVDTALRAIARAKLDVVLVAGRHTLLDRSADTRLLPACARADLPVILGGLLNSGLLADRPGRETFDYAPAPAEMLAMRDRLAGICSAHHVPLRAAALQLAGRLARATTLLGPATVEELKDSLAMLKLAIPEDCWLALDAAYETHAVPPR